MSRSTYTVWVKKKSPPPWGLVAIFPKRLGIFQPNFTCLLCIPIYARLRIFIQISASLTKLCHIKRDHPVKIMCAKCPPSAKTHFLTFFPNSLEFLVSILHAYWTFTYTLECKFLFNYLQLCLSYAILSATTIMWMSTIDQNAGWVVALNMA